ncbi:M48 family metallopeptidase [Liberiplasma polymorphum]|uniref:M48 family metallopeptidase n=1 Tax=Liberiplasma polymorphum TaxID=3374570 RepID=UPI00377476D1
MAYLVIGIIVGIYLLELGLSLLNNGQKNQPIPAVVSDVYDEDAYKNWRAYQAEVFKIQFSSRTLSVLLIIVFLLTGVFGLFEEVSRNISESTILQTLIFIGFYMGIFFVLNIPIKYYFQFVIEEKYGFNKTTIKTFLLDQLKALLLTVVLLGGIIALLNSVYLRFDDNLLTFIGLSWLILMTVLLVFAYLNTRVFVKIFNKLTPLEDGDLKTKIETLVKEIGFKVRGIYIMDASKRSTKLNAFFSGFGKNKEIVLFDTLVDKLNDEEILAVLAHEFGHAVHKDVTKIMVQQAVIFAIFGAMITAILLWNDLATTFGLTEMTFGFALIMLMVLFSPLNFILGIGANYLSRKAEYKADAFSGKYVDKKHMVSALKGLAKENYSDLNPHKWYAFVYYSHPEMALRINAILKN